jgi:tryptophan synthase alpha chain
MTMTRIINKNRIEGLFERKKKGILSVYFSAGYPQLEDTTRIISCLEESGADIVEIGMPFSDPIADGPTIQESNKIALDNGMSLKVLFDQLSDIRSKVSLPIILMGYINPVMQYGIEAFCKKCQMVGVDGLILPDLPMDEYLNHYKQIFEEHNLINVFLITPQTSEERIRLIDDVSKGFIYMVSSSSTTGSRGDISDEQLLYFTRIKEMNLKNPTLIGFGISDNSTFEQACNYAEGAIIGSAFIKALEKAGNLEKDINKFIKSIKSN